MDKQRSEPASDKRGAKVDEINIAKADRAHRRFGATTARTDIAILVCWHRTGRCAVRRQRWPRPHPRYRLRRRPSPPARARPRMGWRCWPTYFQPNPTQACPAGAVQSLSALFVGGVDRPHLRRAQPTSQVGRYNVEALQVMLGGKSVADVLAMTMDGTGTKCSMAGGSQRCPFMRVLQWAAWKVCQLRD